jgi:hypothetical protein
MKKILNMGWLFWISVFAGAAFFVLTMVQAFDKENSDLQAKDDRAQAIGERKKAELERTSADSAREEADKFFKASIQEYQKIQRDNKETLKKAKEIIAKNETVIKTQLETIKFLGGYGYPRYSTNISPTNNIWISVENSEKYPLRNVYISVFDWTNNVIAKMKGTQLFKSDVPNFIIFKQEFTSLSTYTWLSYEFPRGKEVALEIRTMTDTDIFKTFMIYSVDDKQKLVSCSVRTYEIDRQTSERKKLLHNLQTGTSLDEKFDHYFFQDNYTLFLDQ